MLQHFEIWEWLNWLYVTDQTCINTYLSGSLHAPCRNHKTTKQIYHHMYSCFTHVSLCIIESVPLKLWLIITILLMDIAVFYPTECLCPMFPDWLTAVLIQFIFALQYQALWVCPMTQHAEHQRVFVSFTDLIQCSTGNLYKHTSQ